MCQLPKRGSSSCQGLVGRRRWEQGVYAKGTREYAKAAKDYFNYRGWVAMDGCLRFTLIAVGCNGFVQLMGHQMGFNSHGVTA